MCDSLHELEGQHPPGISQPGDVQEPERVTDKAQAQNLDVPHLPDESETEEVGEYFRNVVDHWGHTEECRCPFVVLKVPEEECENQAYSEAHEPCNEQEGSAFGIFELF